LIRTISRDNPLWGAPRIHGELLKLGIDIAQSTVAKYMSRRHGPRSPGWQAFLRNYTAHIAGVDLFVVPTIGFKLLYGLVILGLERRRLVWTDVTANPTAEWIAQQITEAFPWDEAPRYLMRDRPLKLEESSARFHASRAAARSTMTQPAVGVKRSGLARPAQRECKQASGHVREGSCVTSIAGSTGAAQLYER
jgi:hypothetical protein